VKVPPYNVSPTNPDRNVDWARYTPISGAGSVYYKNKTPYTISANLTIERQLGANMLFSICGPFGEKLVYTRANGTVVNGTRAAYPNSIGTDAVYQNMGNANYNSLQTSLRRTAGRLTFLASYTYSKSMDWASAFKSRSIPWISVRSRPFLLSI
jgi:hypothetical protein